VGKSFIAKLYELLISDEPLSKVFIVKKAGVVEGFISITRSRLAINNRVNQFLGFTGKLRLSLFVLLHPRIIKELFNKIMLDNYIAKNYRDSYPSILTLGVSPKYQGKGIGRTLILRSDKYFKEQGLSKYFVDTEMKNKSAVQFYLELGFRPATTISGNIILEKNI
jgi:ribosomal protein S18 acetylase RimI-like enzyme